MIQQLGDFSAGSAVHLKWTTNGIDGSSITRATNGSILIYKNDSATQRTSANGITDTEDFDALTGQHHLKIDLSDNTDAGFYAAGNEYFVVLSGAVIDGKTVNAVLAHFSIENRFQGNPVGTVVADGGNSATTFKTDRAESSTDHWKNSLILFITGTLRGQVQKCSAFNASTDFITVASAFTEAPATGDKFLLVNR